MADARDGAKPGGRVRDHHKMAEASLAELRRIIDRSGIDIARPSRRSSAKSPATSRPAKRPKQPG